MAPSTQVPTVEIPEPLLVAIPVVNTFVQEWACPALLMGFGLDSDGPHSPNEHFSLDSFRRGTKAAAHLLRMI